MHWFILVLLVISSPHVWAQETQRVGEKTPSQEEVKNGNADSSEDNSGQLALPVIIVESPDQTKRASDREKQTDDHDQSDLVAQNAAAEAAAKSAASAERQENLALKQLWLSGVGILALIVTIIYTIKATNAATSAANTANAAYLAEHRPWLKFKSPPVITFGGVVADEELGGVKDLMVIESPMKNTGNSPAVDVESHVEPIELVTLGTVLDRQRISRKSTAEAIGRARLGRGQTIFQGDLEPVTGYIFEISDATKLKSRIKINVCVTYFMSGRKEPFSTSVTLDIRTDVIKRNTGKVGLKPLKFHMISESMVTT